MQKTLLSKAIIVAVLTLLIAIPLTMIQSTISERMEFHREALQSIAADSVREQAIIGPLLVIPYTDQYEEELVDTATQKSKIVKRTISKRLVVYPNELNVKGKIDTDRRYRGIHKALVYSGQYAFTGDFVLPATNAFEQDRPSSTLTIGNAFIALSIDDVRGIRNIPKIKFGNREIEFQQGTYLTAFKSGLHASLGALEFQHPEPVQFSFDLGLDGMEQIHFAPVGKNNQVTLESAWPHPQFGGRFLPSPKTRRIDENGFSATWNISALATNAQQQLTAFEQTRDAAPVASGALLERLDCFSVGFVEPINIYSQADRAIKYGMLFVALTFAAFFLFEILKQLPVHPVQYVLVGSALALFFLLVVSLSEHIRFALAYLIASGGCIVLIGFYLSYVLRNWKRGFGFGCALTALYGVLYGLLQSENNALVMGSILLFGILSSIMIATRKVDWYQVGKTNPAAAY